MMAPLLTPRTPSSAKKDFLLDVTKWARKARNWFEADLNIGPWRKV